MRRKAWLIKKKKHERISLHSVHILTLAHTNLVLNLRMTMKWEEVGGGTIRVGRDYGI